jgi:hypothetical protein
VGAGDDVDRLLTELRATKAAIASNLLDLKPNPPYAAGDGLSEVTAAGLRPALEGTANLWRDLGLLEDVLERAATLRRGGYVSERRAAEVAEVAAVLTGPSVVVPSDPMPLTERDLTTAATAKKATTPQVLISAMDAAFSPLRDVVTAVARAWGDLVPRLDRASAETEANAEGRPEDPTLAALAIGARAALTRPCDLPASEAASAAYIRGLRALPGQASDSREDTIEEDGARR